MDAVETKVKTENSVTVAGAGGGATLRAGHLWFTAEVAPSSSPRTLSPSSKQDKQIRAQVYFVPTSVQPFLCDCSPCCVTDQDLDNTKWLAVCMYCEVTLHIVHAGVFLLLRSGHYNPWDHISAANSIDNYARYWYIDSSRDLVTRIIICAYNCALAGARWGFSASVSAFCRGHFLRNSTSP